MPSDIKSAIVVGAATTSGTSQNITIPSLGWTPKAAIFVVLNGTGGAQKQDSTLSFGFSDGTNHRCEYVYCDDGVATSDCNRYHSVTECLAVNYSGGAQYRASAGMISDGVSLSWNSTPAAAYKIMVILLGGADFSAAVGTVTPNGSLGGTVSVTGLSFQPTGLLFATNGGPTGDAVNAIISVGACDSSLNQAASTLDDQDAKAGTQVGGRVESNSVGGQVFSGAVTWTAEVTAINSDGFTLTTRDGSTGGDTMMYLAIGTGDRATSVDQVASPTATGNKDFSPGFTPQLSLLGVTRIETADSTDTFDPDYYGFAAWTGTKLASMVFSTDDDAATTDVRVTQAEDALDVNESSGSAAFDATLVDADTLNFSAVDSTTRRWWSFQIEAVGGAAAPSLVQLERGIRGLNRGLNLMAY